MAEPADVPTRAGAPPRDPGATRRGGVPAAGLAALVLVLLLDRWGLSREATWAWFDAQQPLSSGMAPGLVLDRIDLIHMERLITAAPGHAKVAVVGTSRARRGLQNEAISPVVGGRTHVYKLAHAGMQPLEVAALTDDLLAVDVDLVVLPLSAFDTHRPLRLDPVTAPGSAAALAALVRAGGWPLVRAESDALLQLGLACLLESYRYREVFRDVGAERFFGLQQLGRRLALANRPGADDSPVYRRALALVAERWPELSANTRRAGLDQILSMQDGPHVAVQRGLLAWAVRRLADADVDVMILEMPLAPLAGRFHDAGLDDRFSAFAEKLAQHERVEFLPGPRLGVFTAADFVDLTHLGDEAALRLSARVAAHIKRSVSLRMARERAARDG